MDLREGFDFPDRLARSTLTKARNGESGDSPEDLGPAAHEFGTYPAPSNHNPDGANAWQVRRPLQGR